jgi:hypothetical protein
MELELKGLADVDKLLAQLEPKQQVSVLRKAVQVGDAIFADAVREAAPVQVTDAGGTALAPGFLAADITARTSAQPDGSVIGIIKPGKMSAHVARWVSDGHRIVRGGRSRKNKTTGKLSGPGKDTGLTTRPNPFVVRAFEQAAPKALEAVEQSIVEQLRKKGIIK